MKVQRVSKSKSMVAAMVLAALLVPGCSRIGAPLSDQPVSIDTAEKQYFNLDLKGAEKTLKRLLAEPDDQLRPKFRAQALRFRARIAWKFHGKYDQACGLLAEARELEVQEYETLAMLSRIQREAGHFEEAMEAAGLAGELAASERQSVHAESLWAHAVWEQTLAAIEDDQPYDAERVEQAVARLKEVLAKVPGYPGPSRILLGLAIVAADGETAFEAWKSYFIIADDMRPEGVLSGPYDLLASVMARWKSSGPDRSEVLTIMKALGDSRFYGYVRLVRQLFLRDESLDDEPQVRDMLLYADTIDVIRETADEYYRMLALGSKDQAGFERALSKQAERLWEDLSFQREKPPYSFDVFCREMEGRFGAAILLGGTSNCRYKVLIMGHLIGSQQQAIEQYGFAATLGYRVYDMMVSNGYSSWFWDGRASIGGWATEDAICEIRTGVIGKFYDMWWTVNDDAERQKALDYIADRVDTEEDAVRADISAPLNALGKRMVFKAASTGVDSLSNSGLKGRQLRMAFVDFRLESQVATKITAHEGRHAIDKKFFADEYKHWSNAEMEYRAKLSEIVFAPDPYLALAEILLHSVSKSGHGKANLRVRKVLLEWMKEHKGEIEGVDSNRPLLVQANLLTADQIRRCFTAADPIAKKSE